MLDRTTRSVTRTLLRASIALGAGALPAGAQQVGTSPPRPAADAPVPRERNPIPVAVDVNMRRNSLYEREDTAGIASLYTEDATYIELMPVLQVFEGRDQIKGHFEELISASARSIAPTVVAATTNADGTILVSGDYVVLSRQGTRIAGHFVQTLRREDGTWRIAVHVFARPDPPTAIESDAYGRD